MATPTHLHTALDPRLNAFRTDLAASTLKGQVEAEHFVDGTPASVRAPVTALRRAPHSDAARDSELLFGEAVRVLEDRNGWSWVQAVRDSYVGYVLSADLMAGETAPTHRIAATRTFVYQDADIKSPALTWLSLNSPLTLTGQEGPFSALAGGGHVVTAHIRAREEAASDYVRVAEALLETPYLWGGRSSLGLDCSGLVQCALEAAGMRCPRDTDMQEVALGAPVAEKQPLQRGDLIFWKGHVGIMRDATTLLHATATHMKTVLEPVEPTIARIAQSDGPVTSIRRLPALAA